MKIRNPRTGIYDYEIEVLTHVAVNKQCDILRNHQQEWAAAGIEHRIKVLQQWKSTVEKYKENLIDALCVDTGRRWETILEVNLVASSIDRWRCRSRRRCRRSSTARRRSRARSRGR